MAAFVTGVLALWPLAEGLGHPGLQFSVMAYSLEACTQWYAQAEALFLT